jgi:hypothetical protein
MKRERLPGRFWRFGGGSFGRRLQFADWLSAPAHAHVLVLESHGDRRIQALLDAHHCLPHAGPNVSAVDLIKLAVPSDGVVIGHLTLFDLAQRRRQIVLFTQRPMGVLHSGRFHRQGLIPPRQNSSSRYVHTTLLRDTGEAKALKIEHLTLAPSDSLSVDLRSGGGFVAMLKRWRGCTSRGAPRRPCQ